jgi:lysophospholipase L1-like esterase
MNDGSISAELHRFFAAYFHQDWDLEADDWEGIVDGYAADHPAAELLRRLAQEIDGLREARPEPDLEQFLVYTVGAYYEPNPLTYKEWLGQIADRLRQHAAAIEKRSAS